tara:strand:- start:51 stop:1331 length:1281 start_codon:yes stop_codon:yes gene_type:complete
MSGIVQNNTVRSSGTIAVAAGGLNWDSAVITGSTLSAEGGKGYFINTTSNTCTITLPSAAEVGDQIVFVDYARTWGTNKIIIDSNGLNYQGQNDTYIVEYNTSGETLDIVYSGATKGWIPQNDDTVADVPINTSPTQKGLMAFGETTSGNTNVKILINSSGVLGSAGNGVGSNKRNVGAAGYGYDKGIFAYGYISSVTNAKNLVTNEGVVAADSTGAGTARQSLQGTTYGGDKAIFAFGSGRTNVSNLVSNTGVLASDTSGVGTACEHKGAVTYGTDGQAMCAYGFTGSYVNTRNLISNQGVVSSDSSGAGTAQDRHQGTRYGTGLGIFVYGQNGTNSDLSTSNKVSITGVIAADVTGVGTGAYGKVASSFGGDKGIYYGGRNETTATYLTESNIVSNSGVVASSVANSGNTSTVGAGGLGYSQSA